MKKPAQFNGWFTAIFLLAFCGYLLPGRAEPVRNGNEMALSYVTNNAAAKPAFSKSVTGVFHAFRYLKVTEIKNNTPREGAVTLVAVEPSSSLRVRIILTTALSLEIVKNLQPGECVSVKGRIKNLGTEEKDLLVLDPAIINHKDRAAPKLSKELLREVDPTAY